MDLHKAIRAIHNNTVSIFGKTQEDIIALDKDQKKISIDWTQVNSWIDPDQYKYDRQAEYPSVIDQLDDIYHNGIDGWKTTIKAVKDKYPKE
tara:strand:- start:13 stop:288 length:276 start_codon:yes stop_codon:yes gene_type:complete